MDQLLVEALAGRLEAEREPDLQTLANLVGSRVRGEAEDGRLESLTVEERFLVETAAEAEVEWLAAQDAAAARPAVSESFGNHFKAVLLWAKQGLEFVWGTMQPVPLAPAAAVRSNTASAARSYCAFEAPSAHGAFQVEIERRPSHGFDLQVSAERSSAAAGWRATLVRQSKLVESAPFDAGRVCFSGLSPDSYRVTLTSGGEILAEFDLKFVTD